MSSVVGSYHVAFYLRDIRLGAYTNFVHYLITLALELGSLTNSDDDKCFALCAYCKSHSISHFPIVTLFKVKGGT